MLCCASSRRPMGYGVALAIGLASWLAASFSCAPRACAQIAPGDGVPTRIYFATLPTYFDGDYRASLNAFLNEGQGGIKTPTSRWIDSIAYFTMVGESYYQLGQMPRALDSYNAALKLYLAYSDWMMRVQFPVAIMPATVGTIRGVPWGQSQRGARIGQFPETFTMGQGRIDNSSAVFLGGVVQSPVLFPVHAAEIVRCTSLAIRRRRELLGAICKYDPLTDQLVNALASHPGPANHWSEAWIAVQLGCAYAAAGNASQASTTLQQALLVGGEYDHPLTSTALLELGHLALEAGDFAAAGRYFEETTYACINYPNPGNLEEAFRFGLIAHLLSNQKVPYPPLVPAILWAKAQGLRQLQASLLLSAAENSSALGDPAQAGNFLGTARMLIGRSDLGISQLGARMNHLTALAAYQLGNVAGGDQALAAALAFQRTGSIWMFQISLADSRYMNGDFTERVGTTLYDILLRDPAPGDWTYSPLECLSKLSMPHGAAYEHWFEAVIKNIKEQDLALEIADRARRHRFFSTLDMGGRLLALRWILEGPAEALGERGLLERQDLLVRYPKYAELAREAAKVRTKLEAGPVVPATLEARREQGTQLAALAEIGQQQEVILREIGVRREAAEMVFPPVRKTRDVQKSMPEGQVLMAFFATSRNLYAFMYSHDRYAAWRINSPAQLQKQIATMLREMGNFDANHEVPPADLAKGAWRATAGRVLSTLLEKSNVDLAGNFDELAIVPDGMVWYLPFEALYVGKPDRQKQLIAQSRVRYAPTVGLAVPTSRAHKPRPNVGVVVGKLHPHDDEAVASAAFEQLGRSVTGAVSLPRSLSESATSRLLVDELIVLDDIPTADAPYSWSPIPSERGKPGAPLASWFALPWGGPEEVILPGFHTNAENALRRGQPAGGEMFLALCGMMASGSQTILISRWRTGGQTSFDLVREFAQELPHISPAEAWQRAVQVAENTPLEPDREPRLKKVPAAGESLKADHPFFWAGYMLVDSGVVPPGDDKLLAIPGLNAPKNAKAQPANPPRVPKVMPANPPAPNPAAVNPAAPDDDRPAKPGKKPKPQPRPTKKAPSRPKPAPVDESE